MLEPFPKDWIYDQISCEIFNFHINFPHRISPHTSSLYQYLHKVSHRLKNYLKIFSLANNQLVRTERNDQCLFLGICYNLEVGTR